MRVVQDLGQGDHPGMHEHRPSTEVDQEQHRDRHPGEGQAGDGHQGHRPGPVEGGELVGRGEIGRVSTADTAEGLDHTDTGDELHHAGGDRSQLAIHLDGLLIHAPQGQGVGQHVEDERGQRQQSQAPVDPEGADEQRQGSDDGVETLNGTVGDDRMHGGRVILDGLADASGGGVGEPGQWSVGDTLDDVAAQPVPQGEVGQVGDEQRCEVEEQPRGVCAHKHHDGTVHTLRVRARTRPVGVQENVTELDQRDVGSSREDCGE